MFIKMIWNLKKKIDFHLQYFILWNSYNPYSPDFINFMIEFQYQVLEFMDF